MPLKRGFVFSNLLRPPLKCLQHVQVRTAFYNRFKHGPHASMNPKFNFLRWCKDLFTTKETQEEFKQDVKRFAMKPFKIEFTKRIERDKTEIFEDFDSEESIKRWKPKADSDTLHGYSIAKFSRSPAGHGLFHGVLDNTCPDDGMTENSGFVCLIGPSKKREWLFKIDNNWDWREYNCLEIRYRGDGRCYQVAINTADHLNDLSFYDNYRYLIHTRGGPYWQTARIPFSKFIFNYRSFVQDRQGSLPPTRVNFVSINLCDKIDGPFALEIDYIGLRKESQTFDEESPYETYRFGHLRHRAIQVESGAPERDL